MKVTKTSNTVSCHNCLSSAKSYGGRRIVHVVSWFNSLPQIRRPQDIRWYNCSTKIPRVFIIQRHEQNWSEIITLLFAFNFQHNVYLGDFYIQSNVTFTQVTEDNVQNTSNWCAKRLQAKTKINGWRFSYKTNFQENASRHHLLAFTIFINKQHSYNSRFTSPVKVINIYLHCVNLNQNRKRNLYCKKTHFAQTVSIYFTKRNSS